MKSYEFMVVFRADFPVDDEKTIRAFVAGMQKEGVYVLATLESERIQVGAIEKEASMGNDVLRYLVTVKKGGKTRN
ncbi:MAG: hypothetical protein UV63_C0057G0009 [Microgenomates group bacterium GW2011_GWC1_43_11]|nr:MAG: hypothetical protein UV63_C0057G0009 [Microgenomates group bacterium GW2011_GWC1_43_11]